MSLSLLSSNYLLDLIEEKANHAPRWALSLLLSACYSFSLSSMPSWFKWSPNFGVVFRPWSIIEIKCSFTIWKNYQQCGLNELWRIWGCRGRRGGGCGKASGGGTKRRGRSIHLTQKSINARLSLSLSIYLSIYLFIYFSVLSFPSVQNKIWIIDDTSI